MSYQRTATPKLYIDNINWLLSNGKMATSDITSSGASMLSGSSIHEFFDMKPSNLQTIDCGGASVGFKLNINTTIGTDATQDSNFIAILGHNLNQAGAKISLQTDDSSDFSSAKQSTLTDIVNTNAQSDIDTGTNLQVNMANTGGTDLTVESGHGSRFSAGDIIKVDSEQMYVRSINSDTLTVIRGFNSSSASTHNGGVNIFFTGYTTFSTNGWSLASFSATSDNQYLKIVVDPSGSNTGTFASDIQIGAILIGEMHTFPHSPDLDIKKKFIFDGVKRQNSVGGQTYTHSTFTKGASWFLEPFEIAGSTSVGKHDKSGRKTLEMGFSYLDDTDVYADELFGRGEVQTNNTIVPNLIHKTHSGMFPLLMQYDKDTATATDSFLWCRLNNEPSFTQVANRVWNTSLSFIEEF